MLTSIKSAIRSLVRQVARVLNAMSGGRITANQITFVGLAAHIVIAYLIALHHFVPAAVLLVIFGLFDTLDGELARLQERASAAGMLLDATTDRFKEVMLYTATAYAIVASGQPYLAIWAVVACGGSLLVSYVKAKGETVVHDKKLTLSELNRLFSNGVMTFEVRMAALFFGLLFNRLVAAVILIAILSSLTAIYRLAIISNHLSS